MSKLGRHVKHGHEHGAAAHEQVHGAASQHEHEHEHGHIGLLVGVIEVFCCFFTDNISHGCWVVSVCAKVPLGGCDSACPTNSLHQAAERPGRLAYLGARNIELGASAS